MKKTIRSIFAIVTVAFSQHTLACECSGFANPQQASQGNDIVVAKVSTVKFDATTGAGTLSIDKVYKGIAPAVTVDVQGQDGFNCSGDILPAGKSWVAIFQKDATGNYMAACSQSSLEFDTYGRIQLSLPEALPVTEDQFSQFVNRQVVPTVKGLSCTVLASRMYVSQDGSKGTLDDIKFYEEVPVDPAQPLVFNYKKDLSSSGLVNPLVANASAILSSQQNYQLYVSSSLTEPFFSVGTSTTSSFDITQYIGPIEVFLNSYQDANGISKDDFGGNPFYAYDANVTCNVTLGGPLVPITE